MKKLRFQRCIFDLSFKFGQDIGSGGGGKVQGVIYFKTYSSCVVAHAHSANSQEDRETQEFKTSLSYLVAPRPVWSMGDPVSQNLN